MSLLVIQIPPKPRQRARGQRVGPDSATTLPPSAEFHHVWSSDGRQPDRFGRCAPALMPKADSVIAVVSDTDVSWHRLLIPKAAPNRLRAALAGLMEEVLLEDTANAHFSLGPQSRPGEIGLVAVTDRRWLSAELAALEQANQSVDRVAPGAWPVDPPAGHFFMADAADETDSGIRLSWADANGVAVLGLQGGLARALLPTTPAPETRFSASPAAAATAEQWLGAPVSLMTENERLLQAANSSWNLRQFDLARRHKSSRALRDIWRLVLGPAWRPFRIGLAALLVVQLIGLNAWAAHLKSQINTKRAQTVSLLQATFPQITGVLDAPLQMRREVQTLRTIAGKPGGSDLEPLLSVAAAAWPAGKPPAEMLRYEPGRLSFAAPGWTPAEIDSFRSQLRASGYAVVAADGQLQLTQMQGPGV